jgi:signal transduction histidine kinase
VRPEGDAAAAGLSYGEPVQRPRFRTWWVGVFPTLVLPFVVGLIGVVGTTFAAMRQPVARPLDGIAYALLLAGPLALVVRRWNPPVVFGATTLVLIGYLAADYPVGPVFLAVLVALGSAVATGHRLAAYSITAVGLAVVLVLGLVRNPDDAAVWTGSATTLAWLAAVIAACEGWRARRERLAQARAAREETERRQGSETRLRIAQELHDVLGHHVSLINVQAGVALYLMDDDP